jgi:hypothetical protein
MSNKQATISVIVLTITVIVLAILTPILGKSKEYKMETVIVDMVVPNRTLEEVTV